VTLGGSSTPGRPLLATKLHAPRRRHGMVERQRLKDRLSAPDAASVTLVSAPAGFGKTSLLAEWLVGDGDGARATSWVSLDAGDNDPAAFWTYAIAAIRRAAPQVGGDSLALLQSSQPLTSVVAALVNDLDEAAEPVVLVLDDYHVIDSGEIHESISYLVDHAPRSFHLVLATRSDPPIALARLRARGQLCEIRAADLRFTQDEATTYFNDTMGLGLATADVDSLRARTEGWIAALQLAALSLQGRDDVDNFIENFTGDDRFLVDYLVEEVLDRQSEAVGSFLLRTSVLDRLTGALCDAVTLASDGRATLELLDRSNLFLVALDDRRQWYRYHQLFADVLRARLAYEDPELMDELHGRASRWYSANGEPAAAIEHALAGRHVDDAARLIELAGPMLRQTRQEGTLRRWLEALPDDIFTDRPVLAMGLIGARMSTGDLTGVEPLLRLVEATLARSAPPPIVFDVEMFEGLPAQVLVQRAGLDLLANDLDGTIAHASGALALVEPTDHLRRGAATALLAIAHWTVGELDAAVSRYGEAIEELTAAGHLADMLGCSLALADIQIVQGRLTDAKRVFDSGLRLTMEHPGLRGAADMHVGLSEVLIERNLLDEAARHLEISKELGESAGLPQHAYRWRVVMARLCRARGDIDGALELIDEAVPLYATDFSPPVRPVVAIRARVQLAHGDLHSALEWATTSRLRVDDELSYVREYEHITLARVLIARHAAGHANGGIDDTIELLNRLLAAAEEGGRMGSAIEVLILQAAAYHARGDTAAAVTALGNALHRAEAEGHIRLFIHAGSGVRELLRSAAGEHPTLHATGVLAAVDLAERERGPEHEPGARPVSVPTATTGTALVEELSSRELDVLRLLRSELSGPEIARELHVSMNTLRTHTKNIYTKLGAASRREAVRRAAEHGL
jgi:LuxR family maltose regulon positive regulatory protein